MKLRLFILPVLAGAVLAIQPALAQAAPGGSAPGQPLVQSSPSDQGGGNAADGGLCRPGTPDPAPPTTEFYDDNFLFGPQQLPTQAPVGPLLTDYRRFGALSATAFIDQYGTSAKDAYVRPPAFGFVIRYDGRPLKAAQRLQPGVRIDRFGSPRDGQFLAPVGTPFFMRGLPPSNLNTPTPELAHEPIVPLANYHVYCVVKPFTVDVGPAASWFAQPSLGTQFKVEPKYLPQGADPSVEWLLAKGYLVEERPSTYGTCSAGDQAASGCPRP